MNHFTSRSVFSEQAQAEQAEMRIDQPLGRAKENTKASGQAEMRIGPAETRGDPAIRASELSYRRLFEAVRDGIMILEADTGIISDANPFLVRMLGSSHVELVGIPIWELGLISDRASNKAKFEQLKMHGYARYDNLPLETKDGRKIAVEFVGDVYHAGDCSMIQCSIRDNTERKQTEGQIRDIGAELEQQVIERTAQLEFAKEELHAFNHSVSHDLRAPLRHVLGFVDLLQRDTGATYSLESLRHLTTISEAAKRMGYLIDDLMDFTRIKHHEMQKSEVNLEQMVRETVKDFKAETQARNIVWTIHPLPAVQADGPMLRLALAKLNKHVMVLWDAACDLLHRFLKGQPSSFSGVKPR